MKYFFALQFIFIFCFSTAARSQMLHQDDVFEKLPERYVHQIKQLDHFIERFNNRSGKQGFRFAVPDQQTIQRDEAIASVFNHHLLNNSNFKRNALEFIKQVIGSASYLSFYDKEYYATVDCKVMYRDKLKDLQLTMGLEGDASNGSRWVIVGARADFLAIEKSESDRIIPPSNHEVDFTGLISLFNENKNDVINYASEDYTPNQLDILFYVIENNDIKLLNTSLPTYHFLQVDGWIFTVDFFNRDATNSGWLISSLKKAKPDEVSTYKQDKLSVMRR